MATFVAMGQAPPAGGQDAWRVDDVFFVGESDDPLAFGSVTAIAFGAPGELAVLDGLSSEVVVLGAEDGRLIRRFGRKGQGPGEFARPTLITVRPSGETLVYDRAAGDRLSRFDSSGQFVESTILEGSRSSFIVGIEATEGGLLLVRTPSTERPGVTSESARMTFAHDGGAVHDVWVWDEIKTRPRLARGEAAPLFWPAARWSIISDSRIAVAQTNRSEVRLLDLSGNVQQVIERLVEPVPLTPEFKASISASQANDERQIEIDFPEFYPLVSNLLPGPDDTIVVVRANGEDILWEILSPDGEILSVLKAPADFRAMAAQGGLVAGSQVTDDLERGVRVVRIRPPVGLR